MAFSEPMLTLADALDDSAQYINCSPIEDIPEGDYVYMGTSSVDMQEGNGLFSLPIYREGDLSERASVTIHTMDFSAVYGRDYKLEGKHKKEYRGNQTILELIAKGDDTVSPETKDFEVNVKTATDTELHADITKTGTTKLNEDEFLEGVKEAEDVIYAPKQATPTEYDDEEEEDADEPSEAYVLDNASETAAENNTSDSDDNKTGGMSELAKLKYAQTGVPTREGTASEINTAQDIMQQIIGAISPEYMSQIPYTAEQTIYFEPEESEAYVTFRLYDNNESDGARSFSITIVDTSDNVETYQCNSTSVIIEDDEETDPSRISFSQDTFTANNNIAQVTVKRENLESSLATARLYATNRDTEEEELLGELVFLPYETEKKVKISLGHDTSIRLDGFSAAQGGDITDAVITGTGNASEDYGSYVVTDEDIEAYYADEAESESLISTAALYDDSTDSGANNANTASSNSDVRSFTITLRKDTSQQKDYTVQYTKGDTVGKIYDTGYTPWVEVGEYYFQTDTNNGGLFQYKPWTLSGDEPDIGVYEANYNISDSDKNDQRWENSYGETKYYSWATWHTGEVWFGMPLDRKGINPFWYQYIIPQMAETSSFGCSDQISAFRLAPSWYYNVSSPTDSENKRYTRKKIGEFSNGFYNELAVRITDDREGLYARIAARDDCSTHTPKCYTEFRGMAAMYKWYEVTVRAGLNLSFKSGGTTIDALPAQIKAKCGAQLLYANDSRAVYTTNGGNDMVFTLQPNTINGSIDKFGELEGYTIRVSGSDPEKSKTVKYPEDYAAFLYEKLIHSQASGGFLGLRKLYPLSTDFITYNQSTINAKIENIYDHLDTVRFDEYFIDWINSLGASSYNDGMTASNGENAAWHQGLEFTPRFKYVDVNVQITAANVEGDELKEGIAEFADSELKEGTTKTYHAGDMLDLTVKSKSDDYTVVGYEVSTDGGTTFNTIRSTNTLLLGTGNVKGYIIRPCVSAKSNWVEIKIANFTDKLHIANVIPQEDLKDYPELKGRYFLDINPNAEDIYERMRPEVGKAYSIDVLVDETNEKRTGWGALLPMVTDRMTGRTYDTNKYYFIARKSRSDNSFTVKGILCGKSNYKDYTLTGSVVTKARSIVNDGLGLHNIPINGYTVQMGAGQTETKDETTGETTAYVDTVSASIGEDGTFTISGKYGRSGDYINVLIDNGVNDAQVIDIKLGLKQSGDTYTQDVGQLVLSYPENAPKITAIAYDYDKNESRSKADLTQNSVRCFDDNLQLTATVDTKGRRIDKVVFVVKTTLGLTETYEATEKGSSESTAVFQATIKDMLKKLHNGDRVYAYIVDKETRRISIGGKTERLAITYPTVDTGLVMYVENELIKPKTLELDNDPMKNYNIPIIGETASDAKSGVLSFSRTNYPNNNGYQLVVNLDMIIAAGNPDTKEKIKAAKKIYSDLQEKDERISAAALDLVQADQDDDKSDSGKIDDDKPDSGKIDGDDLNINGTNANINLADEGEADKGTQAAEKFDEVRADNLANSGLNEDINGLETNEQLSEKYGGQDAGSSKAAAFKNGKSKITGSVFVTVVLQFVLNPVTQQYVMFSAACTVGGMVTINKTWYTMCYAIPFYFNLKGTGQINFYAGGVTKDAQNAISEGDFNNTSGNIKKFMTIGSKAYGGAEFICKVKGQVGAGICGILGARGFVQVSFDALGMQYQGLKDKGYGMLVGISGGIGIDLVVISMDIPFITANQGFGLFEKKSAVTFLGGLTNNRAANAGLKSDGDYDGTVLFGVPTDEYGNPLYDGSPIDEASSQDYAEDESGSENDALSLTAADEASEGTEPVARYYKLGADIEDSFVADDNEASLLDGLFGATPEVDEIITLQENAAEHTRPQLINLDDKGEKQLLVFLGKGQDTKGNATSCLYYTVKDGSGWSEPKPVNTDLSDSCKTNYDTSPCIARYEDTIMVVWMDAREPIMGNASADADFKEKYLKFNVSARLFDTNGKPDVGTITLHDDSETYTDDAKQRFFNMEPSVTVSDDHAYVTYLKRDISSAESEQDLLDLKGIYCTTALISYNFETGIHDKERMIDLHWDSSKADPLVTDCEVQGFKLKSNKDSSTPVKEHDDKDYIAAVYTVDADEDLSSGTDRELYLVIYDITDELCYYPVRLTNDEAVQSSPKLSLINDEAYLTWLNNTDDDADEELKLMNVSEFTENMLYTKTVSDRYDAPDREDEEAGVSLTSLDTATPSELKLSNSSVFTVGAANRVDPYYSSGWKEMNGTDWLISGNDWYKSSVDDKDMKAALQSSLSEHFNTEIDGEAAYPGYDSIKDESYADDYAVSVFGRAANYDLPVYTAVLTRDDGIGEYSLGEYRLAGDGTDVYVFFADFCDDDSHTGKELYAMRFRDSDDDGDGTKNHGFTKPVMLTDEDAVIDEFTVVTNADETVNIAANMYSQNINSDNQLVYGANTLVYMNFKAVGSIEPDSESIEFNKSIKKGEQTETSLVISNKGLYTSEGCDLKLEVVDQNGKTKQKIELSDDLLDYLDDIKLEPGEETKLNIVWTPDIDLEETYLRITASEKTSSDVSGKEYTAEKAIPYAAEVDFIESDVVFDGEKLTITAKLHNTGNKDLDELYVALKHEDASTEGSTELQRSFISGGLKAGEQKELTFTYAPKASDFGSLGQIDFKLSAVSDGDEVSAQYDSYQSSTPVVTELEDGAEHIAVAVGESRALKANAAPWGELAGTPRYSSSDGTVAFVDESGILHALKDGTVTITVYYPKLAVSDTIRIIVGTGGKKEEEPKSGTRNSDRYKRSSAADSTISTGSGIPSGAINGTWNYDPATGKWTFAAGGRQYKSEWAYVYNPYATELQAKADWFRFDEAGYMVTGWFDDTDGNRYFLWPLSNNAMGHMYTGWLNIGTKWYYFKTVPDGTRGALLRSTTTPDGYKVDAEGVWTGEAA